MNIIITKKFSKDVDKELNAQQKHQLVQLLATITQSKTVSEIPDCKKMKGFKNAYRIKFGDFRIGFLWEDEIVKLSRVLNRKDVYKYFSDFFSSTFKFLIFEFAE
ncbi:MAG: type II toxin-antitoxin system RelE family toxin [Chitinophagaceae bacterium]